MAHNTAPIGFVYDTDSSDDSQVARFGRDEGDSSTEIDETTQVPPKRAKAEMAETTPQTPLVDLSQSSRVRVKYKTTERTVEEGLYQLRPVEAGKRMTVPQIVPPLTLIPASNAAALASHSWQQDKFVQPSQTESQLSSFQHGEVTGQFVSGNIAKSLEEKHLAMHTAKSDLTTTAIQQLRDNSNELVPITTAQNSNQPKEESMELKDENGWRVALRQYQLDLYRAARRRNVIAYLDTGSGKTFISVLLIRDIANRISNEIATGRPKRLIFFLVPRKVLVYQQADVLRQFTDLKVTEHAGDPEHENKWAKPTWDTHLRKADIAIMTPQILLDLLRREYVAIVDISLIVFDECHHARKKAPYNCIMQEFYHKAKQWHLPVPKIFGMTASLVTKKRSMDEVCKSFYELETNLDSVIVTASRESVRPHATSANEFDVKYKMNTTMKQLPVTARLIEKASVRMTISNQLSIKHHSNKQPKNMEWQQDVKKFKGPFELQIRQIGNVQHVVNVMGPLAGCYALTEIADNWREREEEGLAQWNFPPTLTASVELSNVDDRIAQHPDIKKVDYGALVRVQYRSLCDMTVAVLAALHSVGEMTARTQFSALMKGHPQTVRHVQLALRTIRNQLDLAPLHDFMINSTTGTEQLRYPPHTAASVFVSHRLQQLYRVLVIEKAKIPEDEKQHWRGMVFVQQTLMAIAMEHMLSLTPQMSFFKCQSLTGHKGSINAAAMADQHQRIIVDMFRSGQVNLLICTSVAEEGLDIAQCSMVIRFDLPLTEASYVQSRGRARKPGSSYIMFINDNDPEENELLERIRFAEQCMKQFASYRQQQPEMDLDTDIISGTREAFADIAEAEQCALMAKEQSNTDERPSDRSCEAIYRYVNQLPQDEFCQLAPHFIFRSSKDGRIETFQYQLTLPLNAAIDRPIVGEWCTSKPEAKRSVCHVACLELRNLGELDERFNPVIHNPRLLSPKKEISLGQSIQQVDSALNPKPLTVPLESSSSSSVEDVVLHPTIVTRTSSADSGIEAFGILTLKRVELLPSFKLFADQYNFDVEYRPIPEIKVSVDRLALLKRYHLAIVESLCFETRLFASACHQKRGDLAELIDGGIDFLPRGLKSYEEEMTQINQSWYLLCPVTDTASDAGRSSLDKAEEDDVMDEDRSCDAAIRIDPIDWKLVERVADRISRLHTPGMNRCIQQRLITVEYGKCHCRTPTGQNLLEQGDIVISAHDRVAYRFVGLRTDLSIHSQYPSYPKREFYPLQNRTAFRSALVPKRLKRRRRTFLDYYKHHLKDMEINEIQPLLECVRFKQIRFVDEAIGLLNSSGFESGMRESLIDDTDDWNVATHLIPQLVVVYPLNYKLVKSLSSVLAVCWKLESVLKVEECRKMLFEGQIERGLSVPDVVTIYESLTSSACNEHCSYERLEFIGDSVLKYITSLYCFFKYPLGHEGVLTSKRMPLISNRHLAQIAVASGLHTYIRRQQLGKHPWRPAGYQFLQAYWLDTGEDTTMTDSASFFQQDCWWMSGVDVGEYSNRLSVKQAADVVESLLGACFVHGDVQCSAALIERLGILDEDAESLLSLLQSSKAVGPWLKGIESDANLDLQGLKDFDKTRLRQYKHGRGITSLENIIGHRFKHPCFALEALTHCSWPYPDPPCYQRLEFLGDAILDLMVAKYYYTTYSNADPHILTLLRIATVNNDRLATIALKAELYKHIMQFSAFMQSHFTEYIAAFSGKDVIGAPKILGDVVESLIGATYLDVFGDVHQTWEVWSQWLQPFHTPDSVPVHPVVALSHHCDTYGLQLDFDTSPIFQDSLTHALKSDDFMDISEDDDSDDKVKWELERLCGKQALTQMDGLRKPVGFTVYVKVNGQIVGEGSARQVKIAKRHAATDALQARPWDLD